MKKLFTLLATVTLSVMLFAQKTPTVYIDNTPIKFQGDLSLPYWIGAGKTLQLGQEAASASAMEFNVIGSSLEFSQVVHITSTGTVPSGRIWKIEAIGLGLNSSEIATNGFSTAATPTIFTSPITYSIAGTYSWIVPPGVTNICIEAWGGGGKGGNGLISVSGGGGGGGGAYGYDCFTVIPGTNYTITVGAGSNAGGQASSVGTLIIANGGTNGSDGSAANGDGIGGVGGISVAGYNINGSNGSDASTSATSGNWYGGSGGSGANGGLGGNGANNSNTPPSNGTFPGGGGGGGNIYSNSQYWNGRLGANGQIIIYF